VVPDRGKIRSFRPEFEDFRKADTPPPVFGYTATNSVAQNVSKDATANSPNKRPRVGSRAFSFSKHKLSLRSELQRTMTDSSESVGWQLRRNSQAISAMSSDIDVGSQKTSDLTHHEQNSMPGIALDQPELTNALKRSSTASVEERPR
jgi:hypothetical protein